MHVYAVDPAEVVLKPKMTVVFQNKFGRGYISYVGLLKRRYVIEGVADETVTMIARPERFLGELGIYNPAARSVFSFARSPRVVTREAELHFASMADALRKLVEGSAVMDWVYNREGYVVGFGSVRARDQINVTLYRYFIKGKPARNIPGCDDSKVAVRQMDNR